MSITEKMIQIEFYLLGEDYTWDTDYIAIPERLFLEYKQNFNPTPIVDWVYANAPLHRNIAMVGIYNDEPLGDDDAKI
jgi:hypothetical protein